MRTCYYLHAIFSHSRSPLIALLIWITIFFCRVTLSIKARAGKVTINYALRHGLYTAAIYSFSRALREILLFILIIFAVEEK